MSVATDNRKCGVATCNAACHIGKAYCLDHYKQLDKFEYGLDAEIQAKLDAKFDPRKAAQAQAWIEALIGERLQGSLHDALKSGVALCKAVNAIKPGLVKNINMMNSPFKHRENIAAYLDACRQLGLKEVELFVTQDLYEGDNLVVVIDNIFAVGAAAQKIGSFHGPYIGVKRADENARNFSEDVLAKGKNAPSRQTVGSYGYQDESKNPALDRQIVKNVTGITASEAPSRQNAGGVDHGPNLSGLDKIIRNPDAVAANRGGGAAPAAPAASSGGARFCGGCGNARQGEAKFCGNCGTPF